MARMKKSEARRFVKGLQARGAIDRQDAQRVLKSLDTQVLRVAKHPRCRDGGVSYRCENLQRGVWTVERTNADGTVEAIHPLGLQHGTFRSMAAIKDELRTIHFGG
jgi:hypothetical protein